MEEVFSKSRQMIQDIMTEATTRGVKSSVTINYTFDDNSMTDEHETFSLNFMAEPTATPAVKFVESLDRDAHLP